VDKEKPFKKSVIIKCLLLIVLLKKILIPDNKSKGKSVNIKQNDSDPKLKPRNRHCVRKTPLYHNATLEAPDGELLCVCDVKKARQVTPIFLWVGAYKTCDLF